MDIETKLKRLNELLLKGVGNLRKQELKEARRINLELAKFMDFFIED